MQALLTITFAEPTRPFSRAELARLAKLNEVEVEETLGHLLRSGVLAEDAAREETQTYHANTTFAFYPELRRIALKSFAAAEPLRTMLRSRSRGTVHHAYLLGEDKASGALVLLIVYTDRAPEKSALDQALHKLLKMGAIRHVIPAKQFHALRAGDALHRQLGADTCVELIAAKVRQPPSSAPHAPLGLFEKARRRLRGLAP